ncbi:nicotinamide riboside transporter PnuC [Marinifilum sp. N1E240]|uniref:nicotinamide riboside transporter PnuC n=1 Tax=Marinifilum sp. N1E240 TaxID=2608082 RepID=UPI00128C24FA|nr:nicotinamide riboside transporter PnuC [Marinifilum sp. N1E240]MPQ45976.1 nicotinamide riboside transporter PnuC [Marinifilum sp. N1E240]
MDWIIDNIIEIIGTIAGLIFLYLEIKQNKWLWPVGLLTSVMYIYVFFVAKLYADMSLQFYYVFISIYGWIIWSHGSNQSKKELPVTHLSRKLFLILFGVSMAIYVFISYVLVNFTDGSVPYWDAFTTALSIVATWMLARKILEQWLVWVVVNSVSLGLYIYKGLYPTSILFFFYTVLAVIGYLQWKKDMLRSQAMSGN